MRPRYLKLHGFVRGPSDASIDAVKAAVLDAGAFVTDAQLYGNVSLRLSFEADDGALARLGRRLADAHVILDDESAGALTRGLPGGDAGSDTTVGSLLVTLVHDEPDRPRVVPAVPG